MNKIRKIQKLIIEKKYEGALKILINEGFLFNKLNQEFLIQYCDKKLDDSNKSILSKNSSTKKFMFIGVNKDSMKDTSFIALEYQFKKTTRSLIYQSLDVIKDSLYEKVLLVGEDYTSFELYRKKILFDGCIVIQTLNTDEFSKKYLHTTQWLSRLVNNYYILPTSNNIKSLYENNGYQKISLDGLEVLKFNTAKVNLRFSEFKQKIKDLDVTCLSDEEVIKNVKNNIRRYKLGLKENRVSILSSSEKIIFSETYDFLYLKNRFYNEEFYYEKSEEKIANHYFQDNGYKNYFSELSSKESFLFESSPQGYLQKKTIILLDPTCFDQNSGISTYLMNMYKFFKMSNLVENTLYMRNHFSSSDKDNREKYRNYIAEIFNTYKDLSKNIVFIDSEAHFPGFYLDKEFNKILITHCSSLLAAKFDRKLPEKMSSGLMSIYSKELANINSADVVISPTRYHDQVQKKFYKSIDTLFDGYKANYLINYINDEYIKFIPFEDREYDLVFIGRPQVLKGFDLLINVVKQLNDVKVAVITNLENEMTDKIKTYNNVTLFLNIRRDEISKILSQSKMLIDLSEHHNCSSVFLEAINSKTPSIVRDLGTYHEILGNEQIERMFLFLTSEQIQNDKESLFLIKKQLDYLTLETSEAHENIDKMFNDFLLINYIQNYNFYENILNIFDFKKKSYKTSDSYNSMLHNKTLINVVHSPAIKEGDGQFIDSFDTIIRFNRALEKIEHSKHGSRTDILYSCINRSPESGNVTAETYREIIYPSKAWVVKAYPNLQWKGSFSFDIDHRAGATYDNYTYETFNLRPDITSAFSRDLYKLVEAFIDCRPNTGVLSIIDLMQYDIKSLYLKGYTFFKGGYDFSYRKQNEEEVMEYMKKAGNHNQYKQNLYIRKLIFTDSRIKYDNSLAKILKEM